MKGIIPENKLRAIYLIGNQPFGRRTLAEEINLSESKTRTFLNNLKKSKYIKMKMDGIYLDKEGKRLFNKLKLHIREIKDLEIGKISVGKKSVAMLLRNVSDKVYNGMEQRDAAIKADASGATVLIYKNKKFVIPPFYPDISKDYSHDYKVIKSEFSDVIENDVVLIASADIKTKAKGGLWAAFHTLMNCNKYQ